MTDLIEAAKLARENAYAPYSGYKVGAAVMGGDGRIWSGCNVENASFPLGMCAERNAIAAMVRDGVREIRGMAVATRDGGAPCGGCLQALLEFSPDPNKVVVTAVSEAGALKTWSLHELLPNGFDRTSVCRT